MAKFAVKIEFTVEADYMEMMEAVIDLDDEQWAALAAELLARGKGVKVTLDPQKGNDREDLSVTVIDVQP
jgi:hypothetical protein